MKPDGALRPAPQSPGLSLGASLFLDVVRFSAALLVAVGHLTQPMFTVGSPHWIDLALYSVTAFFVLSGFVVRHVSKHRPGTLRQFLVDRVSRLYSVLLPALVLTFFADIVVGTGVPYHAGTLAQVLHRELLPLFANLSFTSSIWHLKLGLFTDAAMWSLGFEWFYYALYGVFFYARSWKRTVGLLAVAVLAGPEILTLLPIWLLGCLLYDCFLSTQRKRWVLPALAFCSFLVAMVLLGNSSLRLVMAHESKALAGAAHHFEHVRSSAHASLYFIAPSVGGNSEVSLNQFVWALFCGWGMYLGLLLSDRIGVTAEMRVTRIIRHLSEATFPLYLFHLPLYFLTVSVLGHPLESPAGKVAMFVAVVGLSMLCADGLNHFKLILRRGLSHLANPEPTLPMQIEQPDARGNAYCTGAPESRGVRPSAAS